MPQRDPDIENLRLGHSFGEELEASGCNDGVFWITIGTCPDGEQCLWFEPEVTAAQKVGVERVIKLHDHTIPSPHEQRIGRVKAEKSRLRAAGGSSEFLDDLDELIGR